ncbi:MAG: thermonuclease family protein [Bacillota bacterium]
MKQFLSLLLMTTFVLTLAACIEDEDEKDYELEKGETPVTDRLTLDEEYENKDYVKMGENGPELADGIGEVALEACNDGDTADFSDGDITFTSRFVGIDTPESGHVIEEWGIEAGEYACDLMEDADTIVLEREPEESATGTYGRFLSYVWVDGRLLNLEMIEQGYTNASGVAGYKYADAFYEAEENAKELELRIHGENDPMIPDDDAVDVTIKELVENPDDYMYRKVNLEGLVTERLGNTENGNGVFIESLDSDHGIYFNLGHDHSNILGEGYKVTIEDARFAEDTKDFEGIHITDFDRENVSNPDDWDQYSVEPGTTAFEDLGEENTGSLYHYEGLSISDVSPEEDTFTVKDDAGNTMPVYQHEHVPESDRLDLDNLKPGSIIDLEAPLSIDEGSLTFFLASKDDLTVRDESEETSYYFPEDLSYDGPRLKDEFETMDLYTEEGGETTGGGGSFDSALDDCIDGDTAIFDYPTEIDTRIESDTPSTRFLNVDTPETYDGNRQEWGKSASEYVCDELENAEAITLQTDPGDDLTGDYGRLLAWIWYIPEGKNDFELMNYNTVRQGLGEVAYLYGAGETDVTTYDGTTYTEWMFEAEDDAIENDRGMHGGLKDYYWDYENDEPDLDRW